MRMHMCILMCLLLYIESVIAVSLQERAQQAFIEGAYVHSLLLFDSLQLRGSSQEEVRALSMKAVIYEECLGEIDSAIVTYEKLLSSGGSRRKQRLWRQKYEKLINLGAHAAVYGQYRKVLMSSQPTKGKAEELETLFLEHPDFQYSEELGKLLITQLNELKRYTKALQVMEKMKQRGFSFTAPVYKTARRNAQREKITLFTWFFCFIFVVFSVLAMWRLELSTWLVQFAVIATVWMVVALLFEIVYLIWFKDLDNNPFQWYQPFTLLVLNLLPLLWIVLSVRLFKRGLGTYLLGFIPATLLMILLFHTLLYYQKDPMILMDSFQSQLQEHFLDSKEDKGEGTVG